MNRRTFLLLTAAATAVRAQRYTGPVPPKPDVPFLLHATRLIEVESGQATEETRKDDAVYAIAGASSPVRTPLPEPIFIFESAKVLPKMDLYKMEVKNGRRQVTISRGRRGARPLRLTVDRLSDKLYRIEAGEILEPGEYALTPQGSNSVFCFSVF
jgi:hypothetical protein